MNMQPKPTNSSTRPLSNARRRWLKPKYFCVYIARLKDIVNEWATFACDGMGPADESKRTTRVRGWSRQNWLGCILIIVSLYIQP